MADEKVFTQEIVLDNPFPSEEGQVIIPSTTPGKGNYTQQVTKETRFPTRKVAYELLGSALNTRSRRVLQEFSLTQSGGFAIGNFEEGVSGDVRITPAGITARDIAGLVTFVLDALTGDAVFKGSIQSGSLITGLLALGDNNIVLDGEARRMVFYDENGLPTIVLGNA